MIGKTVSHYKILEKLGEGGMGVVYKAEDTKLKRTVALKFLPLNTLGSDEEKSRFNREAQAAAALDHPNICTVYEIDEAEGHTFIAMAYVDGLSLKKKIESGPLKLEEALDLAIQVAEGLQEAHEKGIVHRDIKSANIMVTPKGQAKILDFGLAKSTGRTKLTKTGMTMGTVAYMSPEQAQGGAVDHRSDIFSFGVLLYEMVTGQHPFKGDYEQAVVYSILNEDPEPMTGLRTGVPMELERIVSKALAKSPDARYQHVDEIRVDLKSLGSQIESGSVTARPTTGKRSAKPISEAPCGPMAKKRMKRSRAMIIFPMVLLLLVLVAVFYFRARKSELPERKMLVVLPFENLGLVEDEYFADGMTEEITARLAGIHGLGVIARTSTIQYKKSKKTVRQIGQELGVDYILEGTVRWQHPSQGPSQVRITPQLIRVSDATHLWADVYEQDISDIFQVQSNIAMRVVKALDIALLEPKQRAFEKKPTDDMEAYQYYLRGNDYVNRGHSVEDLRIGLQMYQKAVELDSNFALAYAKLSYAHTKMYGWYVDRSEKRLAQAKDIVNKAFLLEPDLPEAHVALGYYHYWGTLDFDRALQQFKIAQEWQPNNSDLMAAMGSVQRRQGKWEDCVSNMKKAWELDPSSSHKATNLGDTYAYMRNYMEAERWYNRAILLAPDLPELYASKAKLYLYWKGNIDDARQQMQEVFERGGPRELVSILVDDHDFRNLIRLPNLNIRESFDQLARGSTANYYLIKAGLYGRSDHPELEKAYYDSARIVVEAKVQARPADALFHSELGLAYAGLGLKEEAIRHGETAVNLLPVSREAIRGAVLAEYLAEIYTKVGEYDAAIDKLEHLLSIPSHISEPLLRIDPTWGPLRDHLRFQRLLEEGK